MSVAWTISEPSPSMSMAPQRRKSW
jgi:hypothetical protein